MRDLFYNFKCLELYYVFLRLTLPRTFEGYESGAKRVYTLITNRRYVAAIASGGSGCAPVPPIQ